MSHGAAGCKPLERSTPAVSTADGGLLSLYQAAPTAAAARGAVIVFQEIFGVTPHIQSVVDRLALAGWVAIAPALYHRAGAPVLDYDELERGIGLVSGLDAAELATDLDGALDHLSEMGFESRQCATIGFCAGGTIAAGLTTTHELGAAITYYGGGVGEARFGFGRLLDIMSDARTPWLGHYGDADASIPVEQVEELRNRAATASVPTEIVRHAGAGHAFNCDARSGEFRPRQSAAAWVRTFAWLDDHVAS